MTSEDGARLERAPRYLEVVVGLVSAGLGVVFLGVVTVVALKTTVKDIASLGWVAATVLSALGGLGYFLCLIGWRLLTGRGRAVDGGLLSSTMLQIGGLLFFVGAVIMGLTSKWGILHALGTFGMGCTCFGLARYRRRQRNGPDTPEHVA